MGIGAKEIDIYESALRNGGRYLLPRRYNQYDDRSKDQYDACGALVASGHAKWISATSSFAPGIKLTSKPFAA